MARAAVASLLEMYDDPPSRVTRYIVRRMTRRLIPLLLLALGACRHPAAPAPPSAEFLAIAGDSTFWVRSGPQGVRARGSPLLLARFGGRFHEVYVVDDDRSYSDAYIVGQVMYRRDLLRGDSLLVFDDTTIAGIERWYAREHPSDHPLEPEEDPAEDPHVSATSDLNPLDEHGPYLSIEYTADLTVTGSEDWHLARRGVIDLCDGHQASVADIFGARNAAYVVRRGRALFEQALDSVLHSRDDRAREAADAIGDFRFDSTSFTLVELDGAPAVEFVAPGHGSRAGGLTLPLPPIKAAAPSWWGDAERGMPTARSDSGDTWTHLAYRVESRPSADGMGARLAIVDSAGRTWSVAQLPAPVRRIYWLDGPPVDSATRRALAHAFDEAALYSEEARTAMAPVSPRRARPVITFAASTHHRRARPARPSPKR
jgi:hypothetical protein